MPNWMQWIVGAAALATAIGVLVKKVFLPGYRAAGAVEDIVPVMKDLATVFGGKTDVFRVLDEIASQFRSETGETLPTVVNRLVEAVARSETADELLKIGVEAQKQLAERDRQQLERLSLLLDRLAIRVERLIVAMDRLALDREEVAENLAARELQLDEASDAVASDLAAQRERERQTQEPEGDR